MDETPPDTTGLKYIGYLALLAVGIGLIVGGWFAREPWSLVIGVLVTVAAELWSWLVGLDTDEEGDDDEAA